MITNHVLPIVDQDLLLSEVTLDDVERLQLSLVEAENVSFSTINIIMSAVGVALSEAQRRGLLDRTKTVAVEPLYVVHKQRGILTEDELIRFMVYAKEHSEKRIYLAILLSLLTGMRSGELRALKQSALGEDSIIIEHAYADHAGLKIQRQTDSACPLPFLCDRGSACFGGSNPYEGSTIWSSGRSEAAGLCPAIANSRFKN